MNKTNEELQQLNEDLEEHGIEQTEALRVSDERLRIMIEGVHDYAILMMDPGGYIVYWNIGAQCLKGYQANEIIGQHFSRFYTDEDINKGMPKKILDAAIAEGRFEDEGWRVRKDGSKFWAIVVITSINDKTGKLLGFSIVTRDITERKSAEETLALQKRIGDVFLTIPDDEMFNEVLKIVLEVMQSPFGVFGFIDDNGANVVPTMTRQIWDNCQVPEKSIVFPRDTWGDSSWPRAILEKKPNYSNEISNKTPVGHVTIKRHISLPIIFHDEVIGLFQVANKDIDYTEEDVRLLETIAKYVAPILSGILQRKHHEEEIRRLNRIYAVLSNINQAIVRITDKKKLMDEACRILVEDGGMKLAWVGFIDENTKKIIPYSNYGKDNGYLDNINISILEYPNRTNPIGTCTREDTHVHYDDLRNEEIMQPWREEALNRGFYSVLVLPLKVNKNLIGVVSIYSSEINYFDEEEIKLMEELAADESFALEKIEMEEQRKIVEEKLEESISHLRRFYESGLLGVIDWNMDGQITDANDKFLDMVGYTRDELENCKIDWRKITPPEYREDDEISTAELKATGVNKAPFEKEYIRKDGTRIPILIAAAMLDEERINGVAFVIDITERKKAENALLESEAKLLNAMKITKLGHWEYDVAKDLFTFNDHFYDIFRTTVKKEGGYTMSSLQYAQRFIHPDDINVVDNEIRKALDTTDPNYIAQMEHRIIYADGETGYISVRFFVIKDSHGKTIKTVGANQDITERKRAEKEIREYAEQYFTMKSTDLFGYLLVDENRKIVDVNDSICMMTGYTKKELLNLSIADIAALDTPGELDKHAQMIHESGKEQFESKYRAKDGRVFDVEISMAFWKSQRKNIVFVRDITERKRAEEELKEILATKDLLLKEIHHRVKNNLQVVSSLLKLQSEKVEDKVSKEYFQVSADRVRAMSLIHQQLYRSINISQINFDYYLKELLSHLYKLYCQNPEIINISFNAKGINMNIETAVPCGLLVNEIVTNSFKHAFPRNRKGEIKVDLKFMEDEYTMKVSDDGISLPENINFDDEKTLGIELIKILVDQLDAKMEINREHGTEYIITFKSQTYQRRV